MNLLLETVIIGCNYNSVACASKRTKSHWRMNPNGYQTPDLASVLRTLAAYSAPPPRAAPQSPYVLSGLGDSTTDELEEGEYDPEEALLLEVEDNLSYTAPTQPPKPPSLTTEARKPSPKIPRIDPTTITTWPAALRYVSSLIAREEAVSDRIRKLITVQHQHERQWWEGREALINLQKGREEGRRKVDDILYAIARRLHPPSIGTWLILVSITVRQLVERHLMPR